MVRTFQKAYGQVEEQPAEEDKTAQPEDKNIVKKDKKKKKDKRIAEEGKGEKKKKKKKKNGCHEGDGRRTPESGSQRRTSPHSAPLRLADLPRASLLGPLDNRDLPDAAEYHEARDRPNFREYIQNAEERYDSNVPKVGRT